MPSNPTLWSDANLSNPHVVADKARRVQAMFSAIAPRYDLNNRLHSAWRDQAWRRATVRAAEVLPGDLVVDVACGTGDLSVAFQKTDARKVIGVDFTPAMLNVAQQKSSNQHEPRPAYCAGDAMRLPITDASVNVVSIAFGLRNVAHPLEAIREFHRVLRPGGRLVILEFGLPANRWLRSAYNAYFTHVLPRTAALIARDRSGAYRYLPKSVHTFLDSTAICQMMSDVGFTDVGSQRLTFGIAAISRAVKPD